MKQKANKGTQNQNLKKYTVFSVMILAFGVSMWFIFKPSDTEEKEQSGFNTEIPDPQSGDIMGNKISAYEQEQIQNKKDEKMRSLQDFMFSGDNESQKQDSSTEQQAADNTPSLVPASTSSNKSNQGSGYNSRYSNSSAAYVDINRTLAGFHEQPKNNAELDELKSEIRKLKMALAQSEDKQSAYEDQAALMEKSYQLASKYMGTGQPETNNQEKTDGKIKVTPVKQFQQFVVTSLSQPMSNEEFVKQFSQVRNMGFNTVENGLNENDKNTIAAVIHNTQTVTTGQIVKLRLTEPMVVDKQVLPVNTVITGTTQITGERLNIQISSIEQDGLITPVNITVYDTDGQQGIYIPGSQELNAVKELAGNMGTSLGSGINISQQSAGDQLLSDLGRGAIQGTSQYISRKAKEIKVTLKSGYRILLKPLQQD